MQALVGLFGFSLLLATGTCLKCESCTGFNEDCTGKLELCSEDKDTCATIVTETIIGKKTSLSILKSCYQTSKCLGSSREYSFLKVNVKIECSSSQVGKMEIEGGEALANRKKSRSELQSQDEESDRSKSPVEGSKPTVESPKPTVESPKPTVESPKPTVESLKPTVESPKPTVESPKPTVESPKPTVESPKPTVESPKPTVESPKPTVESPKPTVESPKTTQLVEITTPGNAQQTVASFLLALSSLLFMKIFL